MPRPGQKGSQQNLAEANSKAKIASALGVAWLWRGKRRSVRRCYLQRLGVVLQCRFHSAGTGRYCRIVLLGNSDKSVSKYKIGSGVMKDTLDITGEKP